MFEYLMKVSQNEAYTAVFAVMHLIQKEWPIGKYPLVFLSVWWVKPSSTDFYTFSYVRL